MKNPLFTILVISCTVIRGNDISNNESSLFISPVRPLHYNVYINISLETLSFNGNVEIRLELLSYTDKITVNASQLSINHVYVLNEGNAVKIEDIGKNKHEVHFLFKPRLEKGVYTIELGYEGKYNTSMMGLYSTKYDFGEKGYPGAAAVTYFQPMSASKVFPCFDDPKLKANFNISISRDKNNIAISNMPLKLSKNIDNNQVLDVFEVTPKFSTNQVAFAVCNYPEPTSYPRGKIYVKPMLDDNFYHRLYLKEVSEIILREIGKYFHMQLPMEKVDIMTVRDFPSEDDGIGNWGLVFVSENNLFNNNKALKIMGIQESLMSLIHVHMHALLGHVCNEAIEGCSLLTEGIATFLQYSVLGQFRKDCRLSEQRALTLLRNVVETDYASLYNVMSATKIPYKDPDELYKQLTNNKVAAILLTLQNMVRAPNFQQGLQHFAYRSMDICNFGGTVTPNDFWVSLQEVVDYEKPTPQTHPPLKIKNMAKIMDTWKQPDIIPVLYVRRNYTAPFEIQFVQYPLLDHNLNKSKPWYIPINYATSSKPLLFHVLSPSGGFLEPSKPYTFPVNVTKDEWLIINVQAAYLYLVRYDDTNWKRLANALNSENFGNIPPLTRAKLLYDAFTLVLFDRLEYKTALELLKYLRREKDYIPLNSLFHVLELFYSRFAGIKNFQYLQAFLARSLQPALEHVGFKEKNRVWSKPRNHIDSLNRQQLIKWACLLGNQICRKTTTQMFLKDNFSTLPPDLREVIACAAFIDGDVDVWNKLHYYNSKEENAVINNAFECSQNQIMLDTYVQNKLNKGILILRKIYTRGYFGTNFILNYLVHNWKIVYNSLIESDRIDLIREVARHITTDVQLEMLRNISTNLTTPELEDTFKNAINAAKQKIAWVNKHSGGITSWIRKELINKGSSTVKVSVYICIFFVVLIILF